jgi:hypothetical protein
MAARALGEPALGRMCNMAIKKNSLHHSPTRRSMILFAFATVCIVFSGCVMVPFPYLVSDTIDRGFLEDFPRNLLTSDVKVLVLEQRARVIDSEGCGTSSWQPGCGSESAEQMLEAPIVAVGKDLERIVTDTRIDRIAGVGIFFAVLPAGPMAPIQASRSGTRLKALAIITQDGSAFCTKKSIQRYTPENMFVSYKVSDASRHALIAGLQISTGNATLSFVPGSCELSGALSWSEVDRRSVIEFIRAIRDKDSLDQAEPQLAK